MQPWMLEKLKKKLERHAEEVGCWGLVKGVARSVKNHKEFHASMATKHDGPFYCRDCFSDAVIRKCTQKQDHFAHKARLSPVAKSGEGQLHSNYKHAFCKLLAELFPEGNWATERTIPRSERLNVPELRPDVSGRINGIPIAIEVQASSLTVNKIIARTESYAKRNISLLWVIPLTEELGDKPFRPRQYERYLHSIYYGRVYYWWDGPGLTLIPVHFGVAKRYIELAEWYENGELVQVGGYKKSYKIIKTPLYGPKLHIVDDFLSQVRPEFTPDNERKAVPPCSIWMDKHSSWWVKDESPDNNY